MARVWPDQGELFEVAGPQVLVGHVVGEHVPGRDQHGVLKGEQGRQGRVQPATAFMSACEIFHEHPYSDEMANQPHSTSWAESMGIPIHIRRHAGAQPNG
jgi:hypothetical protein